ncbi:MAG: DUF3306 domain-containing protein [Alphaproteobacteria bacterium]|nr:DUF3306 domain-containing protein [Alphaproteobacteria bacterium]
MSKDDGGEGFLSRWSKRKAEVRQQEQAPAATEPAPLPEAEEEEIDLATLPSIDSLTVESDFSVFLKKGVPLAMRNAALRKLWLTEPSVVNYKALVEYNWDFTAPGYGELLPTDNIAKMAQQVFSGFSQTPKPEDTPQAEAAQDPQLQPTPQPALPAPEDDAIAAVRRSEQPIQDEPAAEPAHKSVSEPAPDLAPPRRRHGGALPS